MTVAKVSKCFSLKKKKLHSFTSVFKNRCDFRVELPVLAITILLLEDSVPGDASGRHLILISISVSFICFCSYNRVIPVGGVLRSQDTTVFSVRLSWAAAISFMQIRYGPSLGSWLVADGEGREICHPQSKTLPSALARPDT